jgi:predicted nucleotidyltransferase
LQVESYGSVKVFWPSHSRESLIADLRDGIRTLARQLPLQRAILFGSWAKGRVTAFSDIDVLVVYEDPGRDDASHLISEAIPLRGLELHLYSASEAELLSDVLQRMSRDGVDLLGPVEGGDMRP